MSSPFQIYGLSSGMDTETMIQQLLAIERQPINNYETKISNNEKKLTAIQDVNTQLLTLKNSLDSLRDEDTYKATKVTSSNEDIVTISSQPGAATGSYTLSKITQLATATVMKTNSTNPGGGLGGTIDKDSILSEAGLGITPSNGGDSDGKFTINSVSIEYDVNTDSLQDIVDKINDSSAGVTASYSADTDKVTITRESGSSPIKLGSGGDRGNLLQALHLTNSLQSGDPVTLTSSVHLKTVRTNEYITSEDSGFGVSVSAGTFTINDEVFTVETTDTLDDIMEKINNSDAQVIAGYDSSTDQLRLTSKSTGAQSIIVGSTEDSSNFLEATFIKNGIAAEITGNNAIFEIEGLNGGAPISRTSNTISDLLQGVTLTLKNTFNDESETEDPVLLTVSQNNSEASNTIKNFITKFNNVVSSIKIKSSPASFESGTKTGEAGALNGDHIFTAIRSNLQIQTTTVIDGLDGNLYPLNKSWNGLFQ